MVGFGNPELEKSFHELGRQAAQPAVELGHEAPEEVLSLEETLEAYNYQLQDPSYVPSVEEFEAMEQLAEDHIEVVIPADTKTPIRYIGTNETSFRKLNPYLARSFLDGISANQWSLSDEELSYAESASQRSEKARAAVETLGFYGLENKYNIQAQQRKHGVLTWSEYIETFPDGWMTKHHILLSGYRKYAERRADLGSMFKQGEAKKS